MDDPKNDPVDRGNLPSKDFFYKLIRQQKTERQVSIIYTLKKNQFASSMGPLNVDDFQFIPLKRPPSYQIKQRRTNPMNEHDISNGCRGNGLGFSRVFLLGLLLLLFTVVLASAGQAGEVYGCIFTFTENQRQALPAGETFSVIINDKPTRVSVGDGGSYRLLLGPGTYTVRYCDRNRHLWSAQIHSLHGPLKQDIQLERKNDETCQ